MDRSHHTATAQVPLTETARAHPGIEHRQGQRRRIIAPARIHWRGGEAAAGIVYNIGRDGMCLRSGFRPSPCTCVDIDVVLSGGSMRVIRIPGLVVHRCEDGFGILFRQLDDDAQTFVDDCLR